MSVINPDIRFTYEDYKSLPDSMEKRYELLDGEIKMVPSPSTKHQFVSRNLEFILHAFVQEHGLGSVLDAPIDVVLGEGETREVVQPDIIFISRTRESIIAEPEVRGAPDLVIEVLSPGTERRDRGYKRHLYGRHGVAEYWIVDPETQVIEVFRAQGAAFECVQRCARDDSLESTLFPGLRVKLGEVFQRG